MRGKLLALLWAAYHWRGVHVKVLTRDHAACKLREKFSVKKIGGLKPILGVLEPVGMNGRSGPPLEELVDNLR